MCQGIYIHILSWAERKPFGSATDHAQGPWGRDSSLPAGIPSYNVPFLSSWITALPGRLHGLHAAWQRHGDAIKEEGVLIQASQGKKCFGSCSLSGTSPSPVDLAYPSGSITSFPFANLGCPNSRSSTAEAISPDFWRQPSAICAKLGIPQKLGGNSLPGCL